MGKKTNQSRAYLRSNFRFNEWIDSARLSTFWAYLVSLVSKFFIPKPRKKLEEDFTKAKKRLKLTNADLEQKYKALFRLSVFIFSIAILIFIYAIYLFFNAFYLGATTSIVVTGIALTLAFRYHFWSYQIQHKKLGCTFREWFSQGLLGGKKS